MRPTRLLAFLFLSCSLTVHADEPKAAKPEKKEEAKSDEKKKDEDKAKDEESSTTNGSVKISGKEVRYKATAAMLPILKPDGTPAAQVFHIAYQVEGQDAKTRPVTFCFNGGPGSSSVWLHLGAFGPKRVNLPADGLTPPIPPGGLVPNEYSILSETDLVFIDPVNTGYSHATEPDKVGDFLGVQEDIQAVGEFIRLWLTREKRWSSPKFIAGESYGGIRGAGLAEHLASKHRIYLNGLIIVSGLLDYDTLIGSTLNDLPNQVLLPALTAVAHYHKKLPPDLQADRAKAIAEAREFAFRDYSYALHMARTLPKAERAVTVKKLARLTGLPEELIGGNNMAAMHRSRGRLEEAEELQAEARRTGTPVAVVFLDLDQFGNRHAGDHLRDRYRRRPRRRQREQPRQAGRGTPARRGAPPGRDGREGLVVVPAGAGLLLAGQLARRPVDLELRDAEHPRPPEAHPRHHRRADLRCQGLRDAHLAAPRPHGAAEGDGAGDRGRAARAERAVRRRAHRRDADAGGG